MHHLCCDFLRVYLQVVFIIISSVAATEFESPDQPHFQNGYFSNPYYSKPYTQRIQQQSFQPRSSRGIPVDLAMRLNSVTDEAELFERFIENGRDLLHSNVPSPNNRPSRRSDDGSSGEPTAIKVFRSGSESSAPKIPKPAVCEPELRTVSLRDSDDPTLFFHQSCTRVKRCGGCCSHDLLSCQPKLVQYTNYTVNVSKYTGKDKLKYLERRIITVEEHLNCTCQCKIKQEDCSPQQKYEKDNCRCVCTNQEAEEKCAIQHQIKLWDQPSCSCRCREVTDCSSGFYFDESSCRCVPRQTPNALPDYYGVDYRAASGQY